MFETFTLEAVRVIRALDLVGGHFPVPRIAAYVAMSETATLTALRELIAAGMVRKHKSTYRAV